MSPVSSVFYTVVTVSIGPKMSSEWEHLFYNIKCLLNGRALKTFLSSIKLSPLFFP